MWNIVLAFLVLTLLTFADNSISQESKEISAKDFLSAGLEAEKNKNYAEAASYYRSALEIKPSYRNAQVLLERVALKKTKEEWAAENLEDECLNAKRQYDISVNYRCAINHFSIHGEPINPKIVQSLTTWLSDTGDQIVSINLLDAQDSNRFYVDDILIYDRSIYYEEEGLRFGYIYQGKTESNIHVLQTSDWGGGSGVFRSLLFVLIEIDEDVKIVDEITKTQINKKKLTIRKIGELSLGDRWEGRVSVSENKVIVQNNGKTVQYILKFQQ